MLQLLITARDQGAPVPTATNAGPTVGPIVPSVESVDVLIENPSGDPVLRITIGMSCFDFTSLTLRCH